MKDKKDLFSFREAGQRGDYLEIDKDYFVINDEGKKLEIVLKNHGGITVSKHKELGGSNAKKDTAEIFLRFKPKTTSPFSTPKEAVIYSLTNLNKLSEVEINSALRKVHTNYIIDEISEVNGKTFRVGLDIDCEVNINGGKFQLLLKDINGIGPTVEINDNEIELDFDFGVLMKISAKDLLTPFVPVIPKKPFSTPLRIFLLLVVLVAVSLIFVFRERIWRWFKGETKQEKKVREQLDIF